MKWSALTLRATKKALKILADPHEPRHRVTFGKVVSVARDSAGRPAGARVQIAHGGGQVNVAGASVFGLAEGADVELTARGSLVAPSYQISRVLRHGIGTGSSDNAPLSTPAFAEAETLIQYIEIGAGGNVAIRTHFIIYQIQEQYVSRLNIAYQLEIRLADTGELIRQAQNQPQELIIGAISEEIGASALTASLTELTLSPPTIFDFPVDGGIVKIDDELIYYDICANRQLIGLTRGYGDSTPAEHESGTPVICLTSSVLIPDIPANTALEARVIAVCPTDGRRSNPSDWWSFQSIYDITPPDWSERPFAPVVISKPQAVLIDWPDANIEIADLKCYLVEVKENEGTTEIVNAGNGSLLLWQADPGTIIMARVAAMDTSDNQSEWSDWGRGVVVELGPAGEEFLENYSFETWPSGWSASAENAFDLSTAQAEGLFGQYARQFTMRPVWLEEQGYNTPLMLAKISSALFDCQEGDVFFVVVWLNIRQYHNMETASPANMFFWLTIELQNSADETQEFIEKYYGNAQSENAIIRKSWKKLEIPLLQIGNFDKIRLHLMARTNFYDPTLAPEELKAVFWLDGAALRRIASTSNSLPG